MLIPYRKEGFNEKNTYKWEFPIAMAEAVAIYVSAQPLCRHCQGRTLSQFLPLSLLANLFVSLGIRSSSCPFS